MNCYDGDRIALEIRIGHFKYIVPDQVLEQNNAIYNSALRIQIV
jgi:hypothetical protein